MKNCSPRIETSVRRGGGVAAIAGTAAASVRKVRRFISNAYLYGEERMVGKNEQGAAAGAAENDIDGTFRHVDPPDLLARAVINEDLSVGNVDIAFAIDGDAFTAALREGLQIAERAVGVHQRPVGDVFRLAADIGAIAGKGTDEAISVEIIGKPPGVGGVRRSLLEHASRGQKDTAVWRNVLLCFGRGHIFLEHLR